jgi:hypothetical protein
MSLRLARLGILAAGCLAATSIGFPRTALAHEVSEMMKSSMAFFKAEAEKMGTPKLEGIDKVAGKDVPALYFGPTKMNDNFALVDEVAKRSGVSAGIVVEILVKSDDGFLPVATNLNEYNGLHTSGYIFDYTAIEAIRADQSYYGFVGLRLGGRAPSPIMGTVYEAGYEPIHDGANNVIGIYYIHFFAGTT